MPSLFCKGMGLMAFYTLGRVCEAVVECVVIWRSGTALFSSDTNLDCSAHKTYTWCMLCYCLLKLVVTMYYIVQQKIKDEQEFNCMLQVHLAIALILALVGQLGVHGECGHLLDTAIQLFVVFQFTVTVWLAVCVAGVRWFMINDPPPKPTPRRRTSTPRPTIVVPGLAEAFDSVSPVINLDEEDFQP